MTSYAQMLSPSTATSEPTRVTSATHGCTTLTGRLVVTMSYLVCYTWLHIASGRGHSTATGQHVVLAPGTWCTTDSTAGDQSTPQMPRCVQPCVACADGMPAAATVSVLLHVTDVGSPSGRGQCTSSGTGIIVVPSEQQSSCRQP